MEKELILDCQNCGASHRSYKSAAKCQWRRTHYLHHFISDKGPFATLHAGKFRLHKSRDAAQSFIRVPWDAKLGLFFGMNTTLTIWAFNGFSRT